MTEPQNQMLPIFLIYLYIEDDFNLHGLSSQTNHNLIHLEANWNFQFQQVGLGHTTVQIPDKSDWKWTTVRWK